MTCARGEINLGVMITFFKMRKRDNSWMMWAKRIGGIAAVAGGAFAVMRMMNRRNKSGGHEMEYYQDEEIPVVTNT